MKMKTPLLPQLDLVLYYLVMKIKRLMILICHNPFFIQFYCSEHAKINQITPL